MGRRENPLDPGAGPVQRFASELRRLRQEGGAPTYRDMHEQTGYSVSTLSQAAAGQRLPSLQVTLAYVRCCAGEPAEWERRWRRAAMEEAAERAANGADVAPYRGLTRFEPGDADLFFGRHDLTVRLYDMCRERRFVAVFGPSGSGKSSLLRAGLIPRLRESGGPGPRAAAVRVLTPGPHPLSVHHDRLLPVAGAEGDTWLIVDQFEELYTVCAEPGERAGFIDRLLAAQEPGSRLRVVVAVRADFVGHCTRHPALTAALQDGTVLVGPMTRDELRQAIVRPATAGGLRVERSLTERILSAVDGEPGGLPLMSHALLETWRHREGKVLTEESYERAGGLHGAIARTAENVYDSLTPAQAKLARRVLLRLVAPGHDGAPDTRRPAARAELNLADGGSEGADDGGGGDGGGGDGGGGDGGAVVEKLVRARLLTVDAEAAVPHERPGEADEEDRGTIELAHEALITSWPRLRSWVEAERDRLRVHRRLTEAARAWQDADRDPALLYRGSRLVDAGGAFPAGDHSLTPGERDFLVASVRRNRQSLRRRRAVTALLAALALLTSTAAVVAFQERATAQAERNTAIFNRLTAEADGTRTTQTSLAAALDLTAHRRRPTSDLYTHLITDANTALSAPLTGHTGIVTSAVYSPDGHTLATAGYDRTARLWDVADPAHPTPLGRPLTGHTGAVNALAFSPDGRTLAAAGADRTLRLWTVTDPRHPTRLTPPLTGHTAAVNRIAFSPDGRTLASASDDGTVRLWNVTEPARPTALATPLTGHTNEVNSAVFSPDGRTLASASVDGTVRLWQVTDPAHPRPLARITVNDAAVYQAVFSPDGRTLATAGNDALVRLWNVTDPSRPTPLGEPLAGHKAAVWSVAFSPDGTVLASGGYDDTIRLWNIAEPTFPVALGEPLTDHTDGIWSVQFSPDGTGIASAGYDETARVWTLPATVLTERAALGAIAYSADGRTLATAGNNGVLRLWNVARPARPTPLGRALPGLSGTVAAVVFSPKGDLLAAAGDAGFIRLWRVTDPARPQPLSTPATGPRGQITSLAVGPDGRTLAAGGADRTIRLWDLTDPAHPAPLGGPLTGSHQGWVTSLAFSPGGTILADGAEDDTVRLWNLTDRRHPAPLGQPLISRQEMVTTVAISPDGRTLASGGTNRSIRLWNLADPAHPAPLGGPLTGHRDWVTSLTFNPRGTTLASASRDSTIRLWNLTDPRRPVAVGQPLTGHTDGVASVAFSPNGHTLASASWDATVRLWELRADQDTERICAAIGSGLTASLWDRYVGQPPFQPPCP